MYFWPKKSSEQLETTVSGSFVLEKKPFWKRKWFWGVFFIVVLIVVFSGGDDLKEEESTGVPSQQSSGTEALCPFPGSWSYVSDNSLRTSTGDNLSPWNIVGDPTILYDQNKFRMWYTAADGRVNADGGGNGGIAYAESADGIQWNVWKDNNSPAGVIDLVLITSPADWDGAGVETVSVMRTPSGEYRMYYTGNRPPEGSNHYAIGLATSNDGIRWEKYGKGPIFEPKNQWELPTCTNSSDPRSCSNGGVLEPSVIYDSKEKIYKMWYAAVGTKDDFLTFRIGYATSADGIRWDRMPEQVLDRGKSNSWNDYLVSHVNVVPDPQLGYHLFYFGAKLAEYCENCALQRGNIGHAYSTDGIQWQEDPRNPILSPRKGRWDEWAIGGPSVLVKEKELLLWYFGNKNKNSIAESGIGFVKAACGK